MGVSLTPPPPLPPGGQVELPYPVPSKQSSTSAMHYLSAIAKGRIKEHKENLLQK